MWKHTTQNSSPRSLQTGDVGRPLRSYPQDRQPPLGLRGQLLGGWGSTSVDEKSAQVKLKRRKAKEETSDNIFCNICLNFTFSYPTLVYQREYPTVSRVACHKIWFFTLVKRVFIIFFPSRVLEGKHKASGGWPSTTNFLSCQFQSIFLRTEIFLQPLFLAGLFFF